MTNARDDLTRDILTETAVNDRGRLATVSLKTVPDNVAYVDWMKVVAALSQAGIVNLRNDKAETVVSKVSSSINQSIMIPADAEMKARDRILQDVMAETPEEDRGRLITVAIDSMPNTVAFIDSIIVVSILSLIGTVDLDDDDDDDHRGLVDRGGWSYTVDDDGRIIILFIGFQEDLDPFDLPTGIVRLERLTHLDVCNCQSFPVKELSSLLDLQTLRLIRCSDLLDNFPAQMKLKYLKSLCVSRSQFRSSSPFLAWMVGGQLPSLNALQFVNMEKNETNCILDTLQNFDVGFQDNLKELSMTRCKLDDSHLETIFFEILSRFPNISSLRLLLNEIQSVQSIVERLKSDKTCFVSKSIRHLDLNENPVMKKMKEDPKEKAAILSFLKTFNTIFKLQGFEEGDVEYALRINHAGRRIVEGSGDRPLPLSVWPIVLARSFEKSGRINNNFYKRDNKNPTGLYYLLRDGRALAGRDGRVSDDSGRLL